MVREGPAVPEVASTLAPLVEKHEGLDSLFQEITYLCSEEIHAPKLNKLLAEIMPPSHNL